MSDSWMPAEQFRPVTAPLTGGTLCRSAENLERIVGQFNVATHPRYRPVGKTTFCNIFLWDVSRALGAEVPLWWGHDELNCNRLADMWFPKYGAAHGWSASTRARCVDAASMGMPAIALHRAPAGPGHVALFMPIGLLAQAGAVCSDAISLEAAFGSAPVTFWTHP